MDSKRQSVRQRCIAGMRGLFVAAAVSLLLLLLLPGRAEAQAPRKTPSDGVTYGAWQLLCQPGGCAIVQRTVRAVILFGYNVQGGALVMQVRLPTDAPIGRPVALRMHKSGTLLQMRVTACGKTYCTASAAPAKMNQVIALFSKEPGGTLGYQLAQDLELEVFSLNGFSRALQELRKHPPKK